MSRQEAINILDISKSNPSIEEINTRYKYLINLSKNEQMKSEYL